jgi:hypothetical protein
MMLLFLFYVFLLHLGEAPLVLEGHGLRFQVADAGLLLLLGAWLWKKRGNVLADLRRQAWLFLLPAAFAGSGLYNSLASKTALALMGLSFAVLIPAAVRETIHSKKDLLLFLKAWLGCSVLLSAVSLAAAAWGTQPHWGSFLYLYEAQSFRFPRITGTFHSPAMYVSFMNVALVFAAILLPEKSSRPWKIGIGLGMVLLFVSALLTLSGRKS